VTATLEHKGYLGSIEPDVADGTIYGRVINIDGGLMYEGQTIAELAENMRGGVDAYLELCAENGVEPRAPYSGKVALRIDPALHARVATIASRDGVSINQVLVDAVEARVREASPAR